MAAVTLTELISRIRQRSDNEHTGSTFVTDAEITRLINVSYAELYGHLIRWSLNMVEELETITATGAANYDLPSDFYSLVAVFRVSGDNRIRLERHSSRHRLGATPSGEASTYRVINNTIEFYPRPSGGTYEVVYVPVCGQMAAPDDTMDGVLGWEEYVVIDCAIHILDKEESDTRQHRADRDAILKRIEDEATAAEMNESWVVESDRGYGGESLLRDLSDITGYRGYRGPIRGNGGRY
jgi:hypothetical protein